MREREQLSRSWVANASAWCDAIREKRIESRRLVTDAAIVAAVLDQNPRTILDVGCGEGWLARTPADHDVSVTGIDASVPLTASARVLGGDAEFFVLSYEQIVSNPAVVGSEFDAVVANFSLLEKTMEALATLLSESGTLIIQTVHPVFACGDAPYVDGWRTETFASFAGEWPERMPWYFRTVESWIRTLAGAGCYAAEIREPVHPDKAIPASIIFVCRRLL